MNEKELINQYNQLPDKIQDLLMSEEIADLIKNETGINALSLEKKHIISKIVGDVLLGNLSYKDFTPTLIDQLAINPVISKNIAQKIESQIFFPIREDLEKIYRRFSFKEESTKEESEVESNKELKEEIKIEEVPLKEELEKPIESAIFAPPIIESTVNNNEFLSEIQPVATKKNILIEEKPIEKTTNKRSFKSLFHFRKSNEEKTPSPIIIGKEQEEIVRPVLEEKSPWIISFDEIKPPKEKIVSKIELDGNKNKVNNEEIKTPLATDESLDRSMEKRIFQTPSEFVKDLSSVEIPSEDFLVTKEKLEEKKQNIEVKPEISLEIKNEQKQEIKPEITSITEAPIKVVNYSENGKDISLKNLEELPENFSVEKQFEKPAFNFSKLETESLTPQSTPINNIQTESVVFSPESEKKSLEQLASRSENISEPLKEEKKVDLVEDLVFKPDKEQNEEQILKEENKKIIETIEKNKEEKNEIEIKEENSNISQESIINKPKEEISNIPQENIIDLRKLKF